MRCPHCGLRVTLSDMTWAERLFWSCLVTIAMNQVAQLYDLILVWTDAWQN